MGQAPPPVPQKFYMLKKSQLPSVFMLGTYHLSGPSPFLQFHLLPYWSPWKPGVQGCLAQPCSSALGTSGWTQAEVPWGKAEGIVWPLRGYGEVL